jgi:heme o synthase
LASLAGMSLAVRGLPDAGAAVTTLFCVVSAVCGSGLLNVLIEEKTDVLMPRCAERGRALDKVGRKNAAILAAALIGVSLAVSWLAVNRTVSLIIAAAVFLYAVLYTLYLKKNSPFGTILGAVPGALPVLAGYASVDQKIGPAGWILFLVLLVWQPPHFLALSLKYREEYEAAGFPSMPVRLGERYAKASLLMYASALLPLTLSLAWLGYCTVWFGLAAFVAGALFLLLIWSSVMIKREFGRAFLISIMYIAVVLLAVVIDQKFGPGAPHLTRTSFLLN